MSFRRMLGIIVGILLTFVGGGCTLLFLGNAGQIANSLMPFFLAAIAALITGVALIVYNAKKRSAG